MTMPPISRLSRRTLFGLGGSTLLAATVAMAWRWRTSRPAASRRVRSGLPIAYADHDGWMLSVAEKRALRPRSGDPAGAAR